MRLQHPSFLNSARAVDAVGAGIAITAAVAFVFCVMGPLRNRSREIAAHFQTAALERQRLGGVVTQMRVLSKGIATMQAQIAASPLQVQTPDALNQRLADLATLCNACKLNVDGIRPGAHLQANRFTVVPIEISGRGSYCDCGTFIHLLHERLPDMSLCRFKLSGNPQDPAATGDFDLRLYWLASLPAGPATAPVAALP